MRAIASSTACSGLMPAEARWSALARTFPEHGRGRIGGQVGLR
jgi:hypothetical protein